MLGDAYLKNEQYDSAEVYLQSVFTEDRYYDTKADACMRLAEIAEIHGKTEIIAKMQQKQIAYMDSAQQKLQTHAILKNIVSQEKSNNDKIRKQYLYSIIVLVTFFSIAGCAIAMNYIRRNKKLKIAEEQQKPKLKVEIRKHSIIEEEYQSSAVYIKLKDIARTLIKVETKENLNEEEWQHLIVLTNIKWNGIITHLNTKVIAPLPLVNAKQVSHPRPLAD